MEYTLRYQLAGGTWKDGNCRTEELDKGMKAVYADTVAEAPLDENLGAVIAIDDSDWAQFIRQTNFVNTVDGLPF